MPSLEYWKSSSTHCAWNPALRLMTTAHWGPAVAMAVTWKPSRHFFLIHSKGKESDTWQASGPAHQCGSTSST